MIQRRAFVAGMVAMMGVPRVSEAQQGRVVKIGYLGASAGPTTATQAFRDGLRERGWIEGQNVTIHYRWLGSSSTDRTAVLAEELVRLGPEIIIAVGNKAVQSAKLATTTVPIVRPYSLDPVGTSLVTSLSRPGQNVTGLTWAAGLEIAGKRLELLKQVSPDISRVVNIWDPGDPGLARYWPAVMRGAEAMSLVAESAEVRSADDVPKVLAHARQTRAALFLWAGPLLDTHEQSDL